jgi:hypothetical protein
LDTLIQDQVEWLLNQSAKQDKATVVFDYDLLCAVTVSTLEQELGLVLILNVDFVTGDRRTIISQLRPLNEHFVSIDVSVDVLWNRWYVGSGQREYVRETTEAILISCLDPKPIFNARSKLVDLDLC